MIGPDTPSHRGAGGVKHVELVDLAALVQALVEDEEVVAEGSLDIVGRDLSPLQVDALALPHEADKGVAGADEPIEQLDQIDRVLRSQNRAFPRQTLERLAVIFIKQPRLETPDLVGEIEALQPQSIERRHLPARTEAR